MISSDLYGEGGLLMFWRGLLGCQSWIFHTDKRNLGKKGFAWFILTGHSSP